MSLITNILAATDFSNNSTRVMDYVTQLAALTNARVHAVHVVDTPEFPVTLADFGTLTKELESHARTELAAIKAQLQQKSIQVTTDILKGHPGKTLLKYVEDNAIDLVCIGTHGHSKVETFLFGSTAEAVLRGCKCPVLSIRL